MSRFLGCMIKVYDKSCGKKMYLTPRGNLMDPVVLKNMGGKMTEFMLKWVPMQKQIQKLLNIDDNPA